MGAVPTGFSGQLAIVDELLREVARMETGERRAVARPASGYERELRLAGLSQRVAQSYTIIEGVLAFVARRIDQAPVAGDEWRKKLILRCAGAFEASKRPALVSQELAAELLELCEFRHVVRNIYPTRLGEARVRENLERLIRAARTFGAECRTFAGHPAVSGGRGRKSAARRA